MQMMKAENDGSSLPPLTSWVADRDHAVFANEFIQGVGMSWNGRGTYQEWMRKKGDETAG
jgi:hypothetical protein